MKKVEVVKPYNLNDRECLYLIAAGKHSAREILYHQLIALDIPKEQIVIYYPIRDENYFSTLQESDYRSELEDMYYEFFGRKIDWDFPKKYTEKMQLAKLYDNDWRKTEYADKLLVRNYVKETIGEKYLIPLLGVWDDFDAIDLGNLPDRFVLKCNHGCNWNLIVNDKKTIDWKRERQKFDSWMNTNFAFHSLELHYKDIIPKIIAEEYIEDKSLISSFGVPDLPDYKFFCFDGKVYCSYTMVDYFSDHSGGKAFFCDRDYQLLPYYIKRFRREEIQPKKPNNYEEMVELAEKLSKGFSHVRVDFYNIEGKIYFGEMTFTPGSGFYQFVPEEFDELLGEQWNLQVERKEKQSNNQNLLHCTKRELRKRSYEAEKIVIVGAGNVGKDIFRIIEGEMPGKIEAIFDNMKDSKDFYSENWKELSEKYESMMLTLLHWTEIEHERKSIAEQLKKLGYQDIAVYGYGYLGQLLMKCLRESEVNVKYLIDKNKDVKDWGLKTYLPNEKFPQADLIIVTSDFYFEEILADLRRNGNTMDILSINDILYQL